MTKKSVELTEEEIQIIYSDIRIRSYNRDYELRTMKTSEETREALIKEINVCESIIKKLI